MRPEEDGKGQTDTGGSVTGPKCILSQDFVQQGAGGLDTDWSGERLQYLRGAISEAVDT